MFTWFVGNGFFKVDSRHPQTPNIPIWRYHCLGEVVFLKIWNHYIDYRLIQCIRGFCSSPLPIKLCLQVPWIDSNDFMICLDMWHDLKCFNFMLPKLFAVTCDYACDSRSCSGSVHISLVSMTQTIGYWLSLKQFAIEVLRVIRLSPCQPDHAFRVLINKLRFQVLNYVTTDWKMCFKI